MDRPCLDRSSFNVWGLGITHWPPFSSSFFLSLSSFVILPTSSSWSTAYLVIEAHTGPPCSISLVLGYHLCPLIFVIHPLYMLLLCLSMLSSPPRSGKLSGYLLFMKCSAEASSEVLTLQCYCLSVVVMVFDQGPGPGQVQSRGHWSISVTTLSCWWCCGSGASKVRLAEPFLAYLLLIPHTASTSYHDLTTRLLL